jgi:general secretion pathway protein D
MFTSLFSLSLAIAVLAGNQTPSAKTDPQPETNHVQFAVEIRLVSVASDVFGRLGPDFGIKVDSEKAVNRGPKTLAFLDDAQVLRFMRAAQEDRRTQIMQAPRMTVRNGEKGIVDLSDTVNFVTELEVVRKGEQLWVQPKNESRKVGLCFTAEMTLLTNRRVTHVDFIATSSQLQNPNVPLTPVTFRVAPELCKDGKQPAPFQMFVQRPSFDTMSVQTTFQAPEGKTALFHFGSAMAESRTESARSGNISKIFHINRVVRDSSPRREAYEVLLLVKPRMLVNEPQARTIE